MLTQHQPGQTNISNYIYSRIHKYNDLHWKCKMRLFLILSPFDYYLELLYFSLSVFLIHKEREICFYSSTFYKWFVCSNIIIIKYNEWAFSLLNEELTMYFTDTHLTSLLKGDWVWGIFFDSFMSHDRKRVESVTWISFDQPYTFEGRGWSCITCCLWFAQMLWQHFQPAVILCKYDTQFDKWLRLYSSVWPVKMNNILFLRDTAHTGTLNIAVSWHVYWNNDVY